MGTSHSGHIPTALKLRSRAPELGQAKNTIYTCDFADREIAKEVKLLSQDDTGFKT